MNQCVLELVALLILFAGKSLECWVIVLVYTTISICTPHLLHQAYNSHNM